MFNTAEAAYLGGYLAAGMSKTGTVGTFGGIQIPTVTVFMDGFADGVDKYNADNGTDVKLLGWDKAKQDGLFAGKLRLADRRQEHRQEPDPAGRGHHPAGRRWNRARCGR